MTSSRQSASLAALDGEAQRQLARATPAGFAWVASGGRWIPAAHLLLISEQLCRIARGEIDRLMVFMPPRHGKSQLISEFTPAWYLGRFPDRRVISASYGAALASTWGRKARDWLEELGPDLFDVAISDASSAAERWDIAGRPGGMITAGIGGPVTGRGAHLLIIDDPVKDAEEAASDTIRSKHWDWWQSVARTRLMPGGAAVLLQTRWHEDDLAGRLLKDMEDGGDQWEVLSLPAVAEAEGDALGRQVGEALWREFYDEENLASTKRAVGGYFWAALYQQRPAPAEGFLFKRKDFRYWRLETRDLYGILERTYVLADGDDVRRFDAAPCPVFQTVDVAMSEDETADYTVVATWTVTPHGDLLLLDLERRHFEEQMVTEFLAACNDKHGKPPMWVEKFGAGRSPLAKLQGMGYPVMEIPAEAGTQSDKITRAWGAIATNERHQLFFPHGPDWLGKYEDELAAFPNAAHDDQVDVTSYAARLVPVLQGSEQRRTKQPARGPKPQTAGLRNQAF
jgi:predicted phage terminase large subunit-like protein